MSGEFDERAQAWDDDPRRIERAGRVAEVLRSVVPLDAGMRLLDFGAGTGLLAQALASDVGSVVLVDASVGMREVASSKAAAGVFGPDALVTTLEERASAAGEVDVVVSLMAVHHVADLARTLRLLREQLRPGGTLAIVDLEKDVDGSFHDPDFVGHHGFDRSEMARLLTEAGFAHVALQHCVAIPKNERTYDLFLATARRG